MAAEDDPASLPQRRSIRLRGYDYAGSGTYFLTLCANHRACFFGEILAGQVVLNEAGRIVRDAWLETPEIRPVVHLDAFVVMPNHFHALVALDGLSARPRFDGPSPSVAAFHSPSQTLGALVRGFKAAATRRISQLDSPAFLPIWQCNYYERIVRNEAELERIRRYIEENPARWATDTDTPLFPWHAPTPRR